MRKRIRPRTVTPKKLTCSACGLKWVGLYATKMKPKLCPACYRLSVREAPFR